MSYRRDVVFETALLRWQHVGLQAAQDSWSEAYRVDGPRLLLPLTSCFECALGESRFVCDPTRASGVVSSLRGAAASSRAGDQRGLSGCGGSTVTTPSK